MLPDELRVAVDFSIDNSKDGEDNSSVEDIGNYKEGFQNLSPHLLKSNSDPDRPFFLLKPCEVFENTLEHTTQYSRVPMHQIMICFYKAPFPANNVPRSDEDLLSDIVYSDTPAI